MTAEQDSTGPLVSVVMATYEGDHLPFLEEAVASVLDQTHRDLELIVVLDGPVPQETRDFLDTLAETDSRVRIVSLPRNRGPAYARNTGIARARGRYVAITDADDVPAPERIEKQLAFIQETGADAIGSFYRLIDDAGEAIGEKQVPVSPEAVRNTLYLFNPIANSTVFARADVLRQHPYPDEHRSGTTSFDGEDYALWVALVREGFELRNQPEYLAALRPGPSFLTRRRGLSPFYTDLRTKLRTLPLYPLYKQPLVLAVGFGVACLRLLPTALLSPAYKLRNRLRYTK